MTAPVDNQRYLSLVQYAPGKRLIVRQLMGGKEFISRLAALGLCLSSGVEILQNPSRGPLLIRVRDTRIALGHGEALKILVEELRSEGADTAK
jgi:ferrous iron transport protein A